MLKETRKMGRKEREEEQMRTRMQKWQEFTEGLYAEL